MKTLIKTAALSILFIPLFSCSTQQPISQVRPDNNKTYEVEYLFEHDGCKVYCFYDRGHYVYFSNCNNIVTSMECDSTGTPAISTIEKKFPR
jgi:hypothetical protein